MPEKERRFSSAMTARERIAALAYIPVHVYLLPRLLGALPFLLFGDGVMAVSLIGVMLFSMTMAVTLALIVSRIPDRCGVAFGFTTLGLFVGTLPVFFFRISSLAVNCVVITVLSAVCYVILKTICTQEHAV